MTDKFEINPFDRSALTDFRLLAGRNNEFRQIRFILRNSSRNQNRIKSILISGDRGVGKTSFLNLIAAEAPINNLIPIRINLTASNSCNSNEFFWYIFNQCINAVFELGLLGGKGGAIDAANQKILNSDGLSDQANWVFRTPILRKNYLLNNHISFEFDQLISDLRLIRKQVIDSGDNRFNEKTKFLILVDESQNIYSNISIIEDIRFIVQSQDLGIGFVFAGDTSYESSEWETVFGGSYRDFEIISLSFFDDVESVKDYFRKSLDSIGWTSEEIEETLFYRFKLACRHIYNLTSGKPAWINVIASKMFERCMNGEVRQLRFDKQAQADVKKLLESSGEIDKDKLDFIEGLSEKYQKWLSNIFASELSPLNKIYFYSKFKLNGENFISEEEFKRFCEVLIKRKILTLIEKKTPESENSNVTINSNDILTSRFVAFDFKSDTIKQWLQINSEGKFSFGWFSPENVYIQFVNDELVTEKGITFIMTGISNTGIESLKLSELVKKVNRSEIEVKDESFDKISMLYKACKIFHESRDKEVLYACLKNEVSGASTIWNIYNYNDRGKLIGYYNTEYRINKLKASINSYKCEDHNFSLEILIEKVEQPNLTSLQNSIIKSGDLKKLGIVLEDQMNDLIQKYIKESDIESSYEKATFFKNLFEEGHDLKIRELNNAAYVFIAKNELEIALSLLLEAKRKIASSSLDNDDLSTALLVYYNLAIIEIKKENTQEAYNMFKKAVSFYEDHENVDTDAGVLYNLELSEEDAINVTEVKENNNSKLCPRKFAEQNIILLERFIETNFN